MITCNELRKLSEFLVNRPGRFHYHFRFEYPTPEEITEYMQDKLPKDKWSEIPYAVSFSRKVKLNYDCLRAIVFELQTGSSFKDAIVDLNIVNLEREKYSVTLRYENGMVAHCKGVWMDMFAEDNVTAWLCDRRGYDYVRVSFDPADATWNERIGGNIITQDKLSIDFYDCDDDDREEKKLIEASKSTKPSYILIKRELGQNIHYAL